MIFIVCGRTWRDSSKLQLIEDLPRFCWIFKVQLFVVVVVFFTLTDRASTIPSNTRGCQSGTWSAGQFVTIDQRLILIDLIGFSHSTR